jgi:hypothetical protein
LLPASRAAAGGWRGGSRQPCPCWTTPGDWLCRWSLVTMHATCLHSEGMPCQVCPAAGHQFSLPPCIVCLQLQMWLSNRRTKPYLHIKMTVWDLNRRAGVSSFAYQGTNSHVVAGIPEAPAVPQQKALAWQRARFWYQVRPDQGPASVVLHFSEVRRLHPNRFLGMQAVKCTCASLVGWHAKLHGPGVP